MGLANSPWPKQRQNNRNTGSSVVASHTDGTLKWFYQTGNTIDSSPVVGPDGTIYFGSDDYYLYALNSNGGLKWRLNLGYKADKCSPAVAEDGTIYMFSRDYYGLYAVNPDGSLKWVYETADWSSGSPAIASDGTIYFGCKDNYLYAVNPDGSLKWRYLANGDTDNFSPAIGSDGTIYFCTRDGKRLYALNSDGTLKWHYEVSDYIYSSPAIGEDGTVYFLSGSRLYAINPDGTLKWYYGISSSFDAANAPSIGPDGTIYFGCNDYYLYAVNPDGSLKWVYETAGCTYSTPVISANNIIYFGDTAGYFYAVNADGTLKWSYYEAGVRFEDSVPAIGADGTVYMGSYQGRLYAFQSVVSFEVTSTAPIQNANNVDPNTNIQITFSDSLDTTTISYDTLQVYGWLPEQYEYQWTYDDGTKTLTLTIPGGLETDASIIVNLTDGLKSTGGVSLTPYALGFSTSKLPLQQCDPPTIIEPATARCARPMIILQAPTPARPRAKWRLHFRVQAYADEGGTQLIGTSDSSTNPELFEYSPDNGLTWNDFPSDGLPREQYGKLIRVRVEVEPRKQVWLKASVGAEDA